MENYQAFPPLKWEQKNLIDLPSLEGLTATAPARKPKPDRRRS